jgi:hypothetical protein
MPKQKSLKLIMLSAMYENGGNTTHRLLDGHPELFVYPFESQPGTKYVLDHLTSMYPVKYRWPVFPSHFNVHQIYRSIIDEEGKVRARTPYVSKFRDADFDLSDDEREEIFTDLLKNQPLTRPNIVLAFFQSTFKAWKNYKKSGKEKFVVGYSPIIGVDGNQIIEDYNKDAYVLHVIRNPFSAYADTKKRPVPHSLDHYITGWILCQQHALLYAQKYPDNFFIVRYEDIIQNPQKVLGNVLKKCGCVTSKTLTYPSWNGEKLTQVYPWGTIRIPTEEVNLKTAKELSKEEIKEIALRTELYLKKLNYEEFYKKIS